MFLSLLGFVALTQAKFDFYTLGPYDANVPKPESILGYASGERHSTFFEQEKVVQALVAASPSRTRRFDYGKSTEGRPLRIVAISSPSNIAKLEDYRKQMAEIAEGKATPTPDMPAIVWINECIHGDESASFESGMWLAYNLIASRNPSVESALKKVIVIWNPVYNPDGHERFVVWYNANSRGDSNPDAYEQNQPRSVHGRTNHYRFDMNRDRVSFSQAETRQEIAEYMRWNPQVYVDQHGQVDTYFFPPVARSVNVNVGRERYDQWSAVLGRATAKSFDAYGWPYFIGETFDFYYPGYLDIWSTLSGAIGLTHETDGGRRIRVEREDGSILTLLDGMSKHFTSALAVIRSSAEHKDELLKSFASYRQDAISGKHAGKFQRVVLTSTDPRPLKRLQEHLARTGIKSTFAEAFDQKDTHDYWSDKTGAQRFPSGSLVVDMAQPQGPMAKTLLEPGSDFEPDFSKEQLRRREYAKGKEKYPYGEGAAFYDTTGWSLPYAYNLKAWWCESAPPIHSQVMASAKGIVEKSPIGWLVEYSDEEDALGILKLMSQGVRVASLAKTTRLDGKTFVPGSFLIRTTRNEPDVAEKIAAQLPSSKIHAVKTGYPDVGVDGAGSESIRSLKTPSLAVVFGDGDDVTQFGSTWFLMDMVFKLPFSAIGKRALSGDLSRYSCIILPPGQYGAPSASLKSWVEGGGCLVVLSSTRWNGTGLVTLTMGKEVGDLPGAIAKAELDGRFFLSYGYGVGDGKAAFAVPVEGSQYQKKKEEGGSVVAFANDEKINPVLSGWTWPEETQAGLADTVWLHDQPVGQGHVILFATDPTSRAMWPGLNKLLLNAMLFGPG